ncbi:MAG: hypothetical protein SFX19_06940 [Alphaproteobacteria bacterium]|nr:hypothetical protein [Alphaproteobacteria bacterium]
MTDLPKNIDAYGEIIAVLEPFIGGVLAGKYRVSSEMSYYDPARKCPDFEHSLAAMLPTLITVAREQNLHTLHHSICDPAIAPMKKLLGGHWERGGGFLYPAENGFMDWHTNHNNPGPRIYLVWCEEGGKSCFFTSPDGGKTINKSYEPAGWSVNVFMLGDEKNPYWHAISSGGTNRISLGFRHRPHDAARTVMQGGALFTGAV